DSLNDLVLGVEEERRRQRLQAQLCGDAAARVGDARMPPAGALVEAPCAALGVGDVDAEYPRRWVGVLEAGECTRIGKAGAARGRPEVDDDRLAGVGGEADRLAGEDVLP